MERKTPRFGRLPVRGERKLSTALSQEPEVGVKWNTQRGWCASHALTSVACGGKVVEDAMYQFAGRDRVLDGGEEADELLMGMFPHAATEHDTVQDVEGAGRAWRL
jgi:hypothetical protein